MSVASAGILLYRRRGASVEVFLVHPGGPFFRNRDDGWWTVPKGLPEPGEEPLDAARREFVEETGFAAPAGPFLDLGTRAPEERQGGAGLGGRGRLRSGGTTQQHVPPGVAAALGPDARLSGSRSRRVLRLDEARRKILAGAGAAARSAGRRHSWLAPIAATAAPPEGRWSGTANRRMDERRRRCVCFTDISIAATSLGGGMARLRTSLFAIALGAPIAVAALEAQILFRQGVEFQINAYTIGHQSRPRAGISADGGFVVVWTSQGQAGEGYSYDVFARRFDSAGSALAGEFQVNTFTPINQQYADVGVGADGRFVVTWQSAEQDDFGQGVFARQFDAGGTPLATEFQVALRTLNDQHHPVIGMQSNGDFVIAWASEHDGSSSGVVARRFDSGGAALASEFQVNTYTPGSQYKPAIAIENGGDFVVAWVSSAGQTTTREIVARRFDAGGPAGDEIAVNSLTTGRQIMPAVGIGVDGDFVVAWRSFQTGGSDGLFARGFGPGGTPLGPEHQTERHLRR